MSNAASGISNSVSNFEIPGLEDEAPMSNASLSVSNFEIPFQLAENWKPWVIENIKRNCTVESMVEKMVEAGIDKQLASYYIQQKRLELEGKPVPGYTAPKVFMPLTSTLHRQNHFEVGGRKITLRARMIRPQAFIFDDFMSVAECDQLMAEAAPLLKRNEVVNPNGGSNLTLIDRTSDGMFFQDNNTPIVEVLANRLSALVNHPSTNFEKLQVMRYRVGGEYRAHFDYFPPEQKGSASHLANGGARIATALLYLRTPLRGGATTFPDVGLEVAPVQGSLLYFAYRDINGNFDRQSLHSSAPVIEGEKWIATFWIRERAQSR